ncbi:MAG: hypothetical protein JEZ09_13960 [Salinivirgaceae bacterium]|nr:hypothetical protein [Salinivirgaceae bacterium]
MKGKIAIFKSLNIEANEIGPVLLLIAQSVFIGMFYGTFDIGAHTLFLKTFPEDMIPKAYIISGMVGILLTTAFSKFQNKINFSKLSIYTLLFISIITLLMWVFFEFTLANWTVFLVFILLGPLNILAILAFWGTVSRIFNLRQGKRLFGIIDTGQVFGIILSSYAIPLILNYLRGTKDLLLISAVSIGFAMLIEIIITRKYKIDQTISDVSNSETKTASVNKEVKLRHFIKDKYIFYMALFVIFSMFAAFFVQYSFLVVTNEQYPQEEDLAKYLGFFTGSMMIFTFIIKTFVYSKLMKTYGLKVSLILSSVLLALFTGIAILVGFFSGYEPETKGFIYFFLFISLSKLFNKTLKDALEIPAFKLLYQSLKKSIRFDVQAKIDGTINEIAALTSGVLLSILGVLSFIKLIHFSVFLFALLAIWTFITIKLYKEYRNSLEKSLLEDKSDENANKHSKLDFSSSNIIDNINLQRKLHLIKNYQPNLFLDSAKELFSSGTVFNTKDLPNDYFVELFLLYLNKNLNNDWIERLDADYPANIKPTYSTNEISRLIKTGNNESIAEALYFLFNLEKKQRLTILWALLRIPDLNTQNYAIRLCGTLNESETINTLIEFLDSKLTFSYSLISLTQMAETNAKQIIQMFYKSDISLTAQLSIIEVIKNAPLSDTFVFLIENLSSHRKEIVEKSTSILKSKELSIEEHQLPKLFHPITVATKTISWDISALASIGTQNLKDDLYYAIHKEYDKHMSNLIDLLSITYDANSVKHVQDHLNSGTSEGIGYALELFDLFLSDEIKPMIITVFEDIPLVEKSRLLEAFFPVEVTSKSQLIIDIINRDPNLISNETKKIALKEYKNYYSNISNDLIAQIFNPIEDIKTTTAAIIKDLNPVTYSKLKYRLHPKERLQIDQAIDNSNDKNILELFNNNDQLQHSLKLSSKNIVEIADYISINKSNNSNFSSNIDILNNYFVFLELDHVNLPQNNALYELYFEGFSNRKEINADENKYILGINKKRMNRLCLTQPEFIQNLINTL